MRHSAEDPLDVEIQRMVSLSISDRLWREGEAGQSHAPPTIIFQADTDDPPSSLRPSSLCPHISRSNDSVAPTMYSDRFYTTMETKDAPCGAVHIHRLFGPTELCHDCVTLTTIQLAIMSSVRTLQGTTPYGVQLDTLLGHLVALTHTNLSELLSNIAWLLKEAYIFSPLDDGRLVANPPLACSEQPIF
ncbi:hypothetical protein C8R48DRAFT_769557 [Suillus tomentosus]|nr:hypothetical protein C8R48DRAFT_769557 [Suillus tomentosus]